MNQIASDADNIFSELVDRCECDRKTCLETILELERQHNSPKDLETLAGSWQLIWTTGTKNWQKMQTSSKKQKISKLKFNIQQTIETRPQKLLTTVAFLGSQIKVCGSFEYTENKIEFMFEQTNLKLWKLPVIAFPMGQDAKGWLQITYLDENWNIQRGNQGGIALYAKIKDEQ